MRISILNVGEQRVRIRIEKLPEDVFLATSDDVQGLVAQGRTFAEAVEIARDVSRTLLKAQSNRSMERSNDAR